MIISPIDLAEEVGAVIERNRVLQPYIERIQEAPDWKSRLNAIRSMYLKNEELGNTDYDYCDPYRFGLHELFSPIEFKLWCDIRSTGGVDMIPQYPVGPYFLDFACPARKIALEADGAAYHDQVKDRVRDQRLWDEFGWRVWRVTGAECHRVVPLPWELEQELCETGHYDRKCAVDESAELFFGSTSTGVVMALAHIEINEASDGRWFDPMCRTLNSHRLAPFPIAPGTWNEGDDDSELAKVPRKARKQAKSVPAP